MTSTGTSQTGEGSQEIEEEVEEEEEEGREERHREPGATGTEMALGR
jgi:hypothetical protein